MSEVIFVDTAAWLALANKSDELHATARRIHRRLLREGKRYLTTDLVILEVANAMSLQPLRRIAVPFIEALQASPRHEVIRVTSEFYDSGWRLYKERKDKDWGLTDCISFVVMGRRQVTTAFTSDRHFEQAGFFRLMK